MFIRTTPVMSIVAFVMMLQPTLESRPALFEGPVVAASDDQLVLKVNAIERAIEVDDDTKIAVDGDDATMASVMPGQLAVVSAERTLFGWRAKSIAAFWIK